jgi:hypothetical protein
MPANAYRRQGGSWTFRSLAGPDAAIGLPTSGISVPLAAPLEGE